MPSQEKKSPVTTAELTLVMAEATQRLFREVAERLRAIEQRIAALEAAPALVPGEFKAGAQYPAGAYATHRGCLWMAQKATAEAPGGQDWQRILVSTIHYRN